jgi:RNA polymerase sigma-70 factor (ECF subfamily)
VTPEVPGPGLGSASDAAVIALASRGDSAAFDELVRRRQSWLRNLLRRLCRDPALADDLAQQTLLQAWRRLASLKSPNAFGSWLRRLAVNVWLQHVRAGAGWSAVDLPVEEAVDEAAVHRVAPAKIGLQLDLDRALAALRPEVRLCVVLAYHEELSHAEISAHTGLPLGTVKSNIRRGAAELRSSLDAYEEPMP